MTEKKSGRYTFDDGLNLRRKQMIIGHISKMMIKYDLTTDDMQEVLDIIDDANKVRAAKKQA